MKKVLKPKTIDPQRIPTQKTNEIVFRLKRPNETQALEFICKKTIRSLKKLIKRFRKSTKNQSSSKKIQTKPRK